MLVPGIVASFPKAPVAGDQSNLIIDEVGNTLRSKSGFDIIWRGPVLPSADSLILLRLEEEEVTGLPAFAGTGTPNETGSTIWAFQPNVDPSQPPFLNPSNILSVFPSSIGPLTNSTQIRLWNQRDQTESNWPVGAEDGTFWGVLNVRWNSNLSKAFRLRMNISGSGNPEIFISCNATTNTNEWEWEVRHNDTIAGKEWAGKSETFTLPNDTPILLAASKTDDGFSFYVSGLGNIPINVAASDPAAFGTYAWIDDFKNILPVGGDIMEWNLGTNSGGDNGPVLYALELTGTVIPDAQLDILSDFVLQLI